MAPRVTNRRAIKFSNSVGKSNRQNWARSRRRAFRKEAQYKTVGSRDQAEDIIEDSYQYSFTELRERPIASQLCDHSAQPIGSPSKKSINNCKNKKREGSPEACGETVSVAATSQTSQDSESVRLAKRRKTNKAVENSYITALSLPIESADKCPRKSLVSATAGSPAFKKQGSHLDQRDDIENSFEVERIVGSSPFARIVVEIPVYEDFDRDAYVRVSASISSTPITQSEAYKEPHQRQRDALDSQAFEVLDLQEILESSSNKYSEVDAKIRTPDNRSATGITRSSNLKDNNFTLELSSSFQISGTSLAQPTPSIGEVSGSSSAKVWQGAQVVPTLDWSASQTESKSLGFEIYQDSTENQGAISQREHSQDTSKHCVLSDRETNSQCTDSQTKRSKAFGLEKQEIPLHTEFQITKDTISSVASEYSAQVWSHISTPRPLSLSLHLPHSLDTSSSILPPRPQTPSDCEMAESEVTSASSKMSYAELAMQARDKVKARFAMTPGVTNAEAPSLSPTSGVSHQLLPVRENIIGIPPASKEISDDDDQLSESGEVTLRLPEMMPTDHIVLLPLVSMVRNVYAATLEKREREITAFLNSQEFDPRVVEQMDAMIEELKLLTDHQDLITEMTLTQSTVTDEVQAKWAETCSTKCLFLRHFLEKLRRYEKHIAILARPGRMLDILESIIKTHGFMYDRPDRTSRPNPRATGQLRITLLPTGLNGGQYVVNRADAVIAFDETFRVSERYSNVLRTHLYEPGRRSPLISLVVVYSAEHLELCLPKLDDYIQRKILLVDFILQKHKKVGELDKGQPLPDKAAATIARFLQTDDYMWPLSADADIAGLEVDPSQQKQIQSALAIQSQGHQILPIMTPYGATKRTLRSESITGPDIDSTKRMRMTPTPGDVASSGDVTRVSDSVIHQSQSHLAAVGDRAYGAIAEAIAVDEEQSRQISSLLEKIDHLEVELQTKQSTEEQLRELVKALEARLKDHSSTLRKFQPKLQQAIADRHKFQVERDAAKSQAVTLTQTIEARVAEIAKFREEKANLETELATVRAELRNSTVPEVAKLVQVQEQVRTLQAEKDRLEKRISNMQKDFEFTRDSYQKASSYTTELRNELSELKEENTILRRRASENIIRIAEIQRINETKEREDRIDELEALLRDRDQELRRKSEELKIKTNGRRETRGTSVPRSPRLGGSGMRPTGGSRGGSPAPGDSREGTASFPSSALASARWGHLT